MSLRTLNINYKGSGKQVYYPKRPYKGFSKVIVDSDEIRVGQVPWQTNKEFILKTPGNYILEADNKDYFLYLPKVQVNDQRWWEDFGWDKHTGVLEMDAVWPPNDTPLWEAPIIKDDWYYSADVNTRDPNEDYWQWRNEQDAEEEEVPEKDNDEDIEETRILKWDVGMGGDGGYPPWPPFDPAYPPEPDESYWWYGYRNVKVNMKQDPRVKINWNKEWVHEEAEIIGIDVLEHVNRVHKTWTFTPEEFADNPLGPKFPEYYCGVDLTIVTLINLGIPKMNSDIQMTQDIEENTKYWKLALYNKNPKGRYVNLLPNSTITAIAFDRYQSGTKKYWYVVKIMRPGTGSVAGYTIKVNLNDIKNSSEWDFYLVRSVNTEHEININPAGIEIKSGITSSIVWTTVNKGTYNEYIWASFGVRYSPDGIKITDYLRRTYKAPVNETLSDGTEVPVYPLVWIDGDKKGTAE